MNRKIILPGGAGLVGQNLVERLLDKGYGRAIGKKVIKDD
jgi:nucleoside-diphosphate-sugar epimerase